MVVNHSGDIRSIWSGKFRFLLAPRLYLLIFLFCPSATPLSFNILSFKPEDIVNITRNGSAYIDSEFLYLTRSAKDQPKGGTGRATYKQPFQLRQNATRKLADFTTTFTFSIYAPDDASLTWGAVDGLAFFLAPDGSELNSSDDGFALGKSTTGKIFFIIKMISIRVVLVRPPNLLFGPPILSTPLIYFLEYLKI
ncbi:putative concanavalin A-like lectin/glucanase domain-containing protein [Rosa chinensis]|uniref:Putative concanavalin A-like lectin/glucanase domain-containing protein n=1 Tax=Rosa chinensis TaxID=74649 RepID=A0A2P6QBR2_ROSCH|nr:putative concanavalin A-like lectin/glucanase domain-containing protein [Rosa chinensis]